MTTPITFKWPAHSTSFHAENLSVYLKKIVFRGAILVEHYFASKSAEHDVILTSFMAQYIMYIRFFSSYAGRELINARKDEECLVLMALLVW